MCGELSGFRNDLIDAHHYRSPTDDRGAASVGVAAIVGDGSVTAQDDNVFHCDPEPIRGDLRETGFLALAMGCRSCDYGDFSAHLDSNAAPLPAARRHHFGWAK